MRFVFALLLLPLAAQAQDGVCPAAPDNAARKADIMQSLSTARDQTEAGFLSDQLWRIWTAAPDAEAQRLLDLGMDLRRQYNLAGSRDILSELVAYCPDYAEGYNQRAFSAFLAQDYVAALTDLDAAIAITPDHVAALSGKALTLIGLQRDDEAQTVLREAVRLNPWLGERVLLREPAGQDI